MKGATVKWGTAQTTLKIALTIESRASSRLNQSVLEGGAQLRRQLRRLGLPTGCG